MNPQPSLQDIFGNPQATGAPSLDSIFGKPDASTGNVVPTGNVIPVGTQMRGKTPLDAFRGYGQTLNRAAGEVVSPFTQVGKSVFDATSSKVFDQAISSLNEQNNRVLEVIKQQNLLPGDPQYERLMKAVKGNLQTAQEIRSQQGQVRSDIDPTGLGNEDVSNLLDKGDYGRAFLRAATGGAGATNAAVFSPLAVPAQALIPSDSTVGKVAQGAITGAALGGPAGFVAGGLFGLLPALQDQLKSSPEVAQHLAEHPEDEKIFNDVLGLSLTVLGQKLASKQAQGTGKPDILNTPVSEVPGRVGTNLLNTAAVPLKYAKPVVDHIADSLEKENLRLTPKNKADLGKKLDDVIDFNQKNELVGNPIQRRDKINAIINEKEKSYQEFLKEGDASDTSVPKQVLRGELENLKKNLAASDDIDSVKNATKVDKIISKIDSYDDNIPTWKINDLKRSAYNKAYNTVNKVADPVYDDVGDILKGSVEKATDGLTLDGKSVADFNQDYGIALTSRRLINAASGKAQLGLLGKAVSTVIGGGIGGSIGGPLGGYIGLTSGAKIAQLLLGTKTRSYLSSYLSKVTGLDESTISSALSQRASTNPKTISANSDISANNTTGLDNRQGGFIRNPFAGDTPDEVFDVDAITGNQPTVTAGGRTWTLDQIHNTASSEIYKLPKADQAALMAFDQAQSRAQMGFNVPTVGQTVTVDNFMSNPNVQLYRGGKEGLHFTTDKSWAANFGKVSKGPSLPKNPNIYTGGFDASTLTGADIAGAGLSDAFYKKFFRDNPQYDAILKGDDMRPSIVDLVINPKHLK